MQGSLVESHGGEDKQRQKRMRKGTTIRNHHHEEKVTDLIFMKTNKGNIRGVPKISQSCKIRVSTWDALRKKGQTQAFNSSQQGGYFQDKIMDWCQKNVRKLMVWLTVFFFAMSQAGWTAPPLLADGVGLMPQPKISGLIEVPEEWGTIATQHLAGEGAPFIILIQDAHSIYDAQRHIKNLIAYLHKTYQIHLVALEGGRGRLAPTLLRTFPDEFVKEQVMAEYLKRGELTAAGLSAVSNPGSLTYVGIENWELYEENLLAYLQASDKKPSLLASLKRIEAALDLQRQKIYSPELNTLHEKVRDFHADPARLMELVNYLKTVLPDLGALERYPHVRKLMESVVVEEQLQEQSHEIDKALTLVAEVFKYYHADRLDRPARMTFHEYYQAYRSGLMDAGSFLKYLIGAGESLGVKPKLTPLLETLLKHTETLGAVQGDMLFNELDKVIEMAQERLIRSEEERQLVQNYKRVYRLQDLVSLKLTRQQWQEYQEAASSHLNLLSDPSMIEPALRYYEAALKRDHAFQENLESLLRAEGAKAVIVLAGGFHTSGLEEFARQQNYSYAVIAPRIDSLEGEEVYHTIMHGNYSYKSYLRTTLYDAFMRHATETLISRLDPNSFKQNLKFWRDNVIRDLAKERRLAKASEYLRYLDFLIKIYYERYGKRDEKMRAAILDEVATDLDRYREGLLASIWNEFEWQLNRFTKGLRELIERDALDMKNVSSLVESIGRPKATELGPTVANMIPDLLWSPFIIRESPRMPSPATPQVKIPRADLPVASLSSFRQALEEIASGRPPTELKNEQLIRDLTSEILRRADLMKNGEFAEMPQKFVRARIEEAIQEIVQKMQSSPPSPADIARAVLENLPTPEEIPATQADRRPTSASDIILTVRPGPGETTGSVVSHGFDVATKGMKLLPMEGDNASLDDLAGGHRDEARSVPAEELDKTLKRLVPKLAEAFKVVAGKDISSSRSHHKMRLAFLPPDEIRSGKFPFGFIQLSLDEKRTAVQLKSPFPSEESEINRVLSQLRERVEQFLGIPQEDQLEIRLQYELEEKQGRISRLTLYELLNVAATEIKNATNLQFNPGEEHLTVLHAKYFISLFDSLISRWHELSKQSKDRQQRPEELLQLEKQKKLLELWVQAYDAYQKGELDTWEQYLTEAPPPFLSAEIQRWMEDLRIRKNAAEIVEGFKRIQREFGKFKRFDVALSQMLKLTEEISALTKEIPAERAFPLPQQNEIISQWHLIVDKGVRGRTPEVLPSDMANLQRGEVLASSDGIIFILQEKTTDEQGKPFYRVVWHPFHRALLSQQALRNQAAWRYLHQEEDQTGGEREEREPPSFRSEVRRVSGLPSGLGNTNWLETYLQGALHLGFLMVVRMNLEDAVERMLLPAARQRHAELDDRIKAFNGEVVATMRAEWKTAGEVIAGIYSLDLESLILDQIQKSGLDIVNAEKFLLEMAGRIRSAAARIVLGTGSLSPGVVQAQRPFLKETLAMFARRGHLAVEDWNDAFAEWYAANHNGQPPPEDVRLFDENTFSNKVPIILDAVFLADPASPSYQPLRDLLEEDYIQRDVPVGIAYEVGSPYADLAQAFLKEFGYSHIFLIPYRKNEPVDLKKLPGLMFLNAYGIFRHGVPLKVPPTQRNLADRAMYAKEGFAHLETIGAARGFLEMALKVLASPYLRQLLDKQPDSPVPVMTEDVLNRLIDFFNALAQTEAMRQAVARAA